MNDDPKFFDSAMKSIWDDQLMKPSQIVIVKDGPLPKVYEKEISRWCNILPEIITICSLSENSGLASALNYGLHFCKYELVARMDSDDVSLPHRFLRQVQFMNSDENIAVSSAFVEEFNFSDDGDSSSFVRRVPTSYKEIISFAKYRSPMNHPCVIFRKSFLLNIGGYPNYKNAQDYALWALMLNNGAYMLNIGEVLLRMRAGHGLIQRRGGHFLNNEIKVVFYLYDIGFIATYQLFLSILYRFIYRSLPFSLRKLLYETLRK